MVQSGRQLGLAGIAEPILRQLRISLGVVGENTAETSLVLGPELGASLHHHCSNDDFGELVTRVLDEIEEGEADGVVKNLTDNWVAALEFVLQIQATTVLQIVVVVVQACCVLDDPVANFTQLRGV